MHRGEHSEAGLPFSATLPTTNLPTLSEEDKGNNKGEEHFATLEDTGFGKGDASRVTFGGSTSFFNIADTEHFDEGDNDDKEELLQSKQPGKVEVAMSDSHGDGEGEEPKPKAKKN